VGQDPSAGNVHQLHNQMSSMSIGPNGAPDQQAPGYSSAPLQGPPTQSGEVWNKRILVIE
jgi:hypothetical protein